MVANSSRNSSFKNCFPSILLQFRVIYYLAVSRWSHFSSELLERDARRCGAGWRADLWATGAGPVPPPTAAAGSRRRPAWLPEGCHLGMDATGADMLLGQRRLTHSHLKPAAESLPPGPQPGLSPAIRRERKRICRERSFPTAHGNTGHIFHHLSLRSAAQLSHLEVIIEANFSFDIFLLNFQFPNSNSKRL